MRTDRTVFNLSHDLIVGWPDTFNMAGTPDDEVVVTEFYMNAPAPGFIEIQKFSCIRSDEIEFCDIDYPFTRITGLPGKPVDPHEWMGRGKLKVRLTPLRLGPSEAHGNIHDVRMRVRYTGIVPNGMRSGETMKLVAFFMSVKVW